MEIEPSRCCTSHRIDVHLLCDQENAKTHYSRRQEHFCRTWIWLTCMAYRYTTSAHKCGKKKPLEKTPARSPKIAFMWNAPEKMGVLKQRWTSAGKSAHWMHILKSALFTNMFVTESSSPACTSIKHLYVCGRVQLPNMYCNIKKKHNPLSSVFNVNGANDFLSLISSLGISQCTWGVLHMHLLPR